MEQIKQVAELYNKHQYDDALEIIEQYNGPDSFEILFYKGKILQKMGKYGEAINCFNEAKAIDPNDPRPNGEIMMINNILSITNNFYYENPYTDLDLIDNL